MLISVINLTARITDARLLTVLRAINRQILEDFAPHWNQHAQLRLEGASGPDKPVQLAPPELRGDAVLYLYDALDDGAALAYHQRHARGVPFGVVVAELADAMGEPWSVALSREALALVADPPGNRLVAGPHPQEDRQVFHWCEPADAVQAESYQCDGEELSNFLLPAYFTPEAELGCRTDFLGLAPGGKSLSPFGINPGGCIGFFDPLLGRHVQFANAGDERARVRARLQPAGPARRAWRGQEAAAPLAPAQRATTRRTGQRYERLA